MVDLSTLEQLISFSKSFHYSVEDSHSVQFQKGSYQDIKMEGDE